MDAKDKDVASQDVVDTGSTVSRGADRLGVLLICFSTLVRGFAATECSRLTSIGASKPLSLTGTEFGGARSVRRPLFLKLAGSRDDKR